MKLEDEIHHQFTTPQQRAAVNVLFTANWLQAKVAEVLRPMGISWQQLNILNILHGQPERVASVNLIRERMVDRMPNVSRLLNKLMEKGLIRKVRCTQDQRVVFIHLTEKGNQVRARAGDLLKGGMITLSDTQSDQLNTLLEAVRK